METLQWLDWLDLNAVVRLDGHNIMLQNKNNNKWTTGLDSGIDEPKS